MKKNAFYKRKKKHLRANLEYEIKTKKGQPPGTINKKKKKNKGRKLEKAEE